MKVLNLYYSSTGNTQKVAECITASAEEAGHQVDTVRVPTEAEVDVLGYDRIFAGSGVYQWLPGRPMVDLVGRLLKAHGQRGEVQLCCPRRPGKKAVVYCTYGGPHTGVNEAVPAAKWLGQFFEHLGIEVVAEWYVVGAFHGELAKNNTGGRLGDISGRPSDEDLRRIAEMVKGILKV
jgi:hypothetical protein